MTPTPGNSPFSTMGHLGGGSMSIDVTPGMKSESSPRNSSLAALRTELTEVQQGFLRQRELLVFTLRKGAQMEGKTNSMRDDLIRKDVVIHNLRQELSGQQQETKQKQLYEQQQHNLQQQHLQQLQQVRQLQEYQALLQQQQQQQLHVQRPGSPLPVASPLRGQGQPVAADAADAEIRHDDAGQLPPPTSAATQG